MYQATRDPYRYPDSTVLKNRADLRTQGELDRFEAIAVAKRAQEPLPVGKLSYSHFRAVHRHLFRDVYSWAGLLRRVRITKGSSTFCYPENIGREMKRLFAWLDGENYIRDLDAETFAAEAAHFLAELNAIHPFREGNGRAQNVFLLMLADRAGHPLDLDRLNPPDMVDAMIASFGGDEQPLATLVLSLMRVRQAGRSA
jgi:cell filamentation protein